MLAAAVGLAASGLMPSGAQEAPEVRIMQGSAASATAVVAQFVPAVGGVNFAVSAGVALSKVTNQVAVAQAESLDFGLVGLILSALQVVPASELPQPLIVDNRKGDVERDETDYPVVGEQLGAGRKRVQATKVPASRAQADVATAVSSLLTISAGHADAVTTTLSPTTREGRSSVSVDIDIAGVVQLSGLRWEAHHRTGSGAVSTASFAVAHAIIGGVAVPTESYAELGALINAALAPSGIVVRLPMVERTSAATDLVRVTALEVELRDTELGRATLGPILDLSREQREDLFDQVNAAYGPAGIALLVADIMLTIAGGQGAVTARIGGAEASSGDLALVDPFGDPGSVAPAAPAVTPGAVVLPPVASRPTMSRSVAAGTSRPVATTERCRSIHAERPRGCSEGSLLPLGLAGLAAAVAVGGLDARHQRRHRVAFGSGTPSAGWRALRSYGPLAATGLGFAVLAVSVTVPRDDVAYRGPVEIPSVGAPGTGGSAAPGLDDRGRSAGSGSGARGGSPGQTTSCRGRARQVPGDPYSPPCYAFSGDNGGATSVGVTGDTIRVTVRQVEAGSATDIFVGLAGQSIQDSSESVGATLDALAEYFSGHFQLYGRRLEIELFRGQGNGLIELLGGGKEAASADAVQAAEEFKPFADISGNTLPYADGLAQHHVVNVGAPYPSRAWYQARRPYSWSLFPDGTNVVEASTSAIVGRYPPGSSAEHAGGSLRGKPRRFAVVAPENAEYQESVNVLLDRLRSAGIDVALNVKYKLDLQSMPNQASNAIAKLNDAGVTSVLCYCDPAMLAFGMTPKANEQQYQPEWITAGLVFVDQDVVSQAIDPRQWSHAFGTAYNAESERIGASFPYAAYKSVRPDDEPALGVEELYYQMYLLVLGIQMAGPNLTPETFEAGLFAYPNQFGPRGTWGFGSGDYTPTNDYRELWWDPTRLSTQNDKPGTWVELNGGRRYSPTNPPKGRAPFFEAG